ncbi:MAG: hypothetical protein ACRBBS_04870 [Thalassovita sp.]
MQQADDWSRTRLMMAAVGAAGGLASWGLAEVLPDMIDNARLLMFLFIAILGFFMVLLSLAGPNSVRRATLPALGMSLAVAVLTVWASLRFAEVKDFLDAGHPAAALIIIYLVATPFVSVRLEHGRAGWLLYEHLFQTAWGLIVRAIAAALFTGVFWGVLFLSDALLGLVGIDLIERIIDLEPMPFLITGTVVGLALAVAHEWREYVSPHLLLRLFRLLVPLVVPVLALFIIAVGLSGLEGTLNFFSETALLTAVAIGGITLVTVSVDRDRDHQVSARWMVWMVRALAVLLLPVALLALWGIGARVLQYGWTPQRVLAALCVFNISLYGLVYAALVLWRGDWMRRVRRANVGLALWTLLLAVLWLTPVLNAERLSATTQAQRILSGRAAVKDAAIWEMSDEWGGAGKRALSTLRDTADYPQRPEILVQIDRAEGADSRWDFERNLKNETTKELSKELHALVPVFPEGQSLPETAFDGLRTYELKRIKNACEAGSDGCLFLMVPFRPDLDRPEGLLAYATSDTQVEVKSYQLKDGKLIRSGGLRDVATSERVRLTRQNLADIRAGQYEIAPAPVNVLKLGGNSIFPDN